MFENKTGKMYSSNYKLSKFLHFSEQNVRTNQIQLEECETPIPMVERINSPPLMIIPTPIHSGKA